MLFAGAGISTENRNVERDTFYDTIAAELGKENSDTSFPSLMEEFCSKPHGRVELLSRIRRRFRHIRSFPELDRMATRFHEELATFFQIDTIVTTNWDMYFEEKCGATPFVTDEDLAFWESGERRVLKIHGSINNYGSIVATTSNYESCEERLQTGIIGGILKALLATKTVVFVGYSLTDSDFRSIFEFVLQQMKGLNRSAFVINPFPKECDRFKEMGLLPIQTDATFFLSELKKHFVAQHAMLPDSIYAHAARLHEMVCDEHHKFLDTYKLADHPQLIYCASYQDAMMHAYERIGRLRTTGELSHPCNITGLFKPYTKWQKEKLRKKQYEDVAYIEGYMNAYTSILIDHLPDTPEDQPQEDEGDEGEQSVPPLYFAFGAPNEIAVRNAVFDLDAFETIIDDLPELHKASFKRAKRIVDRLGENPSVVFHHPPWL